MASPTEDTRTSRRGVLAGLAGLAALLLGRRRARREPDKPPKRNGRLPWIGHY